MGTPAFLLVVGFAMWVYEIIKIDYIWTKKNPMPYQMLEWAFSFCRVLQHFIPSLYHMYLISIHMIISPSMQGVPSTRSRCPGQSWTSRKTKVSLDLKHIDYVLGSYSRNWMLFWEAIMGNAPIAKISLWIFSCRKAVFEVWAVFSPVNQNHQYHTSLKNQRYAL